MNGDLFGASLPGLTHLPGYALPDADALHAGIAVITAAAPFRHMQTARGQKISAAMSNCGDWGWTSSREGYGYAASDPLSGAPWPAMPAVFASLANRAAGAAGFPGFAPDACLINRYAPGAQMSLHQDRDETDFTAPIVSVSLGLPAVFLWGGATRQEKAARLALAHGDVLVWGGPARLNFHGIVKLKPGAEAARINLTFRKAK